MCVKIYICYKNKIKEFEINDAFVIVMTEGL